MLKVNEIISIENSLFSTMETNYTTLYETLFGTIEPSDMDMNLLVNCGERYASSLLAKYPISNVVNYIVNKFGDSWERIKETLELEYNVLEPYKVTNATDGTKTVASDTNSFAHETSGVAGFDSSWPTDSDMSNVDNVTNVEETQTDNTTVINGGNLGSRTNADLITNEIEMRKSSFISLVLNDIQTQITLDIY